MATDVNDIVGYIARTRRYALETAGIACSVELQPALPPVHGDRAQLEQVMLNLLTNAEQALATRPMRSRRSQAAQHRRCGRATAHEVVIEIEDNGPGIPGDARSRIWDPFWTTKEEGEGTGLGLCGRARNRRRSRRNDRARRSRDADRRAIRHPTSRGRGIDSAQHRACQASRPLDVLVVDPGASDLLFVERFLTARGHAVINAGSGELALRLAEQTTFDAVVCDARLIDRDGTPIAAALRALTGCVERAFRFVRTERRSTRKFCRRRSTARRSSPAPMTSRSFDGSSRAIDAKEDVARIRRSAR